MIEIVVFEDDLVEDDEDFFVDLTEPTPSTVHIQKPTVRPLVCSAVGSPVAHLDRCVHCVKDLHLHLPVQQYS